MRSIEWCAKTFQMIFSDPYPRFQGHGNALDL